MEGNRKRLGDVAVFENRKPEGEAKFITKSSLFILLPGVIRRLELKPISESRNCGKHIFVAPSYCQTAVVRKFTYKKVSPIVDAEKLLFLVHARWPKN